MSETKFLRGVCQHCGGPIEFPAEAVGTATTCPHCGQDTELVLSLGETEPAKAPVKTIVFIALAALILIGGLAGAVIALKRAQRMATRQPVQQPPATNTVANPFAAQQFLASSIALEQTPGSSLVRAVGTIQNLSAKRRFGVRVEIELQDENGVPVGSARDYTATLDPNATWAFKAMVNTKGAAIARVTAIKEEN